MVTEVLSKNPGPIKKRLLKSLINFNKIDLKQPRPMVQPKAQ